MRITPRWGCSSPATARSSVDLPAPLVPEQGHDLTLGHLEVDVEQHLVGAVVEVEVVDLQGRQVAAGLAALALGVALEDVLDDQGDVAPHVAGPDQQHQARR